ncbi:MAG TPA: TIGR04086 family membrane protein [Clostridiaceae bacterium]|nr:TIGR04086 family membrane protein [Clostridiaceae bacterium]
MEENYKNIVSSGYFKGILKAVAVSLTVTLIILLVTALLLCFTDFPEMYTFPSAIAATVLGVFSGSSVAAKKNRSNSLLSAMLTAFIYAFISFVIGSILERRVSFTLNTALFVVIALLTGAIASILSNRVKGAKNYNKSSSGILERINRKKTSGGYRFKSRKL